MIIWCCNAKSGGLAQAGTMRTTMLDPKLAGVIEEARTRAGKSKYQLAIETKLSLNTIRLATQGIATLATLVALARVLGTTVDALTGRTGVHK